MKSLGFFALLAAFCGAINLANAGNILCLMGSPTNASRVWSHVLFTSLAEKGHQMIVASPGSSIVDFPSTRYVGLERMSQAMENIPNTAQWLPDSLFSSLKRTMFWYQSHLQACRGAVSSQGLASVMRTVSARQSQFNLIIYDATHGLSCLLSLAHLLPGVPIIGVSAFKVTPELLDVVRGTSSQPATVPFFTTEYTDEMDYWQRFINAGLYLFAFFFREVVAKPTLHNMLSKNEHLIKARLPAELLSLRNRIKLVLVNSHPAMDSVQALPPNVIEVGGLHLKSNSPLSPAIQTFINRTKEGIVLVSLGSTVHLNALDDKHLEVIIDVIKSLPDYGFLWRLPNRRLPEPLPTNLYVSDWLPQSDILAQPKIKAFITHAGHMSMQEAIFHAVPIVAVPLELDQFSNAKRVFTLRFGTRLDLKDFNAKKLLSALNLILKNRDFRGYAQGMQSLFRHRANTPLETAVWYVERLLELPAAFDYMISPTDYSYMVQHSWDATLFILLVAAVLGCIMFLIMRYFTQMQARQERKFTKKKKKRH